MAENHDTVKREFLEFSRVLDSAKQVYEIGSTVGCYKLVSMLGGRGLRDGLFGGAAASRQAAGGVESGQAVSGQQTLQESS